MAKKISDFREEKRNLILQKRAERKRSRQKNVEGMFLIFLLFLTYAVIG